MPTRLPSTGAVALVVLLQAVVVVLGEFPASLTLERAFPVNHRIDLGELKNRDSFRHRRILQQQSSPDVVDFPVEGTYDPYRVGLYYTKVQLGTPPRDYYVQIDTGSDVLWVSCSPCNGCPTSSRLQIPIEFYDPSNSSTSSTVSCSDSRCSQASRSSDSGCSNGQCSYNFPYRDGSGTSGYYVSDYMHLNTIGVGPESSNSSANVVFGCSTSRTGETKTESAVEGIFGFGQNGLSIISQLSSQGIAPDSFSHCLVGTGSGGGILVIGQIIDPNMVYTPLVQSQTHYHVNLESISVNGQTLPIDPSTFSISDNQGGTIIDSGTTLTYLAEDAYTPFVDAITRSVSQSVQPLISKGNRCYLITSSVSDVFPTASLNFAGGASMRLRPQDYLLQQNSVNGAEVWCIGFQTISNQGITILGDLVLKDKIIVYDLGGQRIGWSDYDCTSSVNVSATTIGGRSEVGNAGTSSVNVSATTIGGRSEVGNAGQFNAGSSMQITRFEVIAALILASVLHLAVTVGGL